MDLAVNGDVMNMVGVLTSSDWNTIVGQAGDFADKFIPLLQQKVAIENFLGINLVTKAGLTFPGVLIPLLSAGSTFLQSKLMTANQAKPDPNDPMASSMKMMTYTMPLMMGIMTINMPAGLGLYWTISNCFQILQQLGLNKFFKSKEKRANDTFGEV